MLKRFLIIGATLLVAFFYAYWSYQTVQVQRGRVSGELGSVNKGLVLKQLPDTSFEDLAGEEASLRKIAADSTEKNLYIHFWGTWCAPCEAEFPELLKFIQKTDKLKNKFLLVAINDEVPKVNKFLDRYKSIMTKLNIQVLIDNDGKYFKRFGTAKVPETYVFESKTFNAIEKFTGPQNWLGNYYIKFSQALDKNY